MERFNRLRSKPAIAGWISIAVLIWKILGEINTLNSVVQNVSTVWNFLSTPVGMLVLLLVGLGLIAYAVFRREDKKLEEKKTEINEKPKSWLYQFLKTDKDELGKRIHQFRERWFFDDISSTEPFMEVIIKIVNAAVFPIVIKGVEGSFQIQGTKCNWDAATSLSRIPHGEAGDIRISQRLLKETVEMMVQLHNERGGFMVDLNTCSLVIQAEDPDMENEPVRIRLQIHEQVSL